MLEVTTIATSFRCRMRTASTIITAQGTDPPQPVPTCPMADRKYLRIMHNGWLIDGQRQNVLVMLGGVEARYPNLDPMGFGIEIDEWLELPVGEEIIVYAVVTDAHPGATADLRTIELA